MATGKSTIGEILAKKIGYGFIDTDEEIENKENRTIKRIFETDGESYFRIIEAQLIKDISNLQNQVIACGGGLVLNHENVTKLKKSSIMVLLTTTPQEILNRVKKDQRRPLLNVDDKLNEIKRILKKRNPTYEKIADVKVDTTNLLPEEVVEIIFESIKEDLA
jgi:shikimate kinase